MRAVLSVWDKSGIVPLARRLAALGWEIVSTGGTLRALVEAGVPATPVSEVTGFPEILEGRVKTLHPAIHAGILARRDRSDDLAALERHGIVPVDLVAVNLYPFADVAGSGSPLGEALEHIDIGGPALLRAAAKNFPSVIPLVDPADYEPILQYLESGGPAAVPDSVRRNLAAKAFAHVASYDAVIAGYLRTSDGFPEELAIALARSVDLRYGENPHQPAALYTVRRAAPPAGVQCWHLRSGPEMSYNNYLDATAAWRAVSALPVPSAVIVKHANPCGAAHAPDQHTAFRLALEGDPVSAFGGIVAFNAPLEGQTATAIAERVFDVVLAPAFSTEAITALARRRNVRVVETPSPPMPHAWEFRSLDGAVLVQQADDDADEGQWRVVTRRQPTADEWDALRFAWRVVRFVTSNAIVLARGTATVGIGGGQPNRVDAVRLATWRAGERARGAVLASDAFFPFPDGIEVAADAGVTAVIQPGGSRRDGEVVAAAERAGIAMVFTGRRHFRH